jgi:hypothetical protein
MRLAPSASLSPIASIWCCVCPFSTRYALQRFGADEFSVRQCLPSASLTLAFVSAIATTQLSRVWLEPSSLVAHIGVGAVAFGAVLGAAYLRERQFVRDLRAITAKKAD